SQKKDLLEAMKRISQKQPAYKWEDYETLRNLFLTDGDNVNQLSDQIAGFSDKVKEITDTFKEDDKQAANLSRPLRQFVESLESNELFPEVKGTTSKP